MFKALHLCLYGYLFTHAMLKKKYNTDLMKQNKQIVRDDFELSHFNQQLAVFGWSFS